MKTYKINYTEEVFVEADSAEEAQQKLLSQHSSRTTINFVVIKD